MKKSLLLFVLALFQMPAFCQSSGGIKLDSLSIDSIAAKWILNDTMSLGDVTLEEDNKIWAARERILKSRVSKSISDFSEKTSEVNREKRKLIDSLVKEIQIVPTVKGFIWDRPLQYRVTLANLLLQTRDSMAIKYLFEIGEGIFDGDAWHSDFWAQYPVLHMLYRNSQNNLGYYPYIQERLMKSVFEDFPPTPYLYARMLMNIFYGEREILYIKLNKLLQQYPENEVLKTNIETIKSYIYD